MLGVAPPDLVGQVLAREPLLQHVHEMNRIGRDLGLVVVEHRREHLVGEAGGQARHAFVGAGVVAIFLQRLGLGVDVLQRLAVVHAHLGVEQEFSGSFSRDSTENCAIMSSVPGAQGALASEEPAMSFS